MTLLPQGQPRCFSGSRRHRTDSINRFYRAPTLCQHCAERGREQQDEDPTFTLEWERSPGEQSRMCSPSNGDAIKKTEGTIQRRPQE